MTDLNPDELEVSKAVAAIRRNYFYKRDQLIKSLARRPTAEEMLMVAREEIKILSTLHKLRRHVGFSPSYVIPASLLVQTFLTKLLQAGILSSSTEETAHDQPE